jgi:hypothetical protein
MLREGSEIGTRKQQHKTTTIYNNKKLKLSNKKKIM